MNYIRRLTIGAKLGVVFASILLVIVVTGVLSVMGINAVNSGGEAVRANWLPGIQLTNDLGRALDGHRLALSALVSAADADSVREAEENMGAASKRVDGAMASLLMLPTSQEEAAYCAAFKKILTKYDDVAGKIDQLVIKRQGADARDLFADGSDLLFSKATQLVMRISAAKAKGASDAVAAAGATYRFTVPIMVGSILAASAICLSAAAGVFQVVVRPLRRLAVTVAELTSGDVRCDFIAAVGDRRGDELGALARALNVLRDGVADRLTMEAARAEEQAAKEQRTSRVDTLVRHFENKMDQLVGLLASGSTGLESTAKTMSSTAALTNKQATRVASAAQEASSGARTVATAAEELTASIHEITHQVAQSAKMTAQAVANAQHTNVIVRALADGADKIDHILTLITSIAGQTNLLALNATIEAARAGDAGKGFAVVASEVKSLASQTANAAGEIGGQIAQLQLATKETVDAIRGIAVMIEEVSAISMNISAAVEEQGAATTEIARSVEQTARSAEEVTTAIGGVSQAAVETGTTASQVLDAAANLSLQAAELTREVSSFIAEMQAA